MEQKINVRAVHSEGLRVESSAPFQGLLRLKMADIDEATLLTID
jgi:hypothetical protein